MKIIRKLISITLLSSLLTAPVFAADTSNLIEEPIQYSSLEEFAISNDAELFDAGFERVGGDAFEYEVSDNKTRAKYKVYVDWDIGYNSSSRIGLTSYVRAYSTNSNCLLRSVYGTFEWDDPNSYASGLYEVSTVNNLPTYQIFNAIETKKTFSSGKKLNCTLDIDIDAISEITGGSFYATDTVTIP